jgi:predicted ATP-grasp superfamily ATP-dependent carboligase
VPHTEFCETPGDLEGREKLIFPLIVKPARSKIVGAEGVESTEVLVAKDAADLAKITDGESWLRESRFMLQEKIEGTGQGVFAVYNHGNPVAFFAHKRLREKPPQGGVSTLCESCTPEPQIQAYAEKLLTALNWHGAAMVEFKVSKDGTPYLMEINGRLWGSLQLAVRAGFDVPNMLVDLALGKTITPPDKIRTGLRNRWLLGDFDHLLLQLRGKGTANSIGAKLRSLLAFLNFFDPRTRLEVFRWSDPRPFFFEMRQWFRDTLR